MQTECYCSTLRGAARKATAIYDDALAPVGITLAQFRLLRIVERSDEPMSLTELGRRAELDRSTIGRNVRLLQKMALLRVVPGEDQREATVVLDGNGRLTLQRGVPLWEVAQQRIEVMLGPDTAARLRSLLQTL